MSITLDTLVLPDDLYWSDRYEWSRSQMSSKRTIRGRRVITPSVYQSDSGRPITLTGDDTWISKADLDTLFEWSQQSAETQQMTLRLHDGESFLVIFRLEEQPVIQAAPVLDNLADPTSKSKFVLTSLKLEVI